MLARLNILMPYTVTVAEGDEFKLYEVEDGALRYGFFLPNAILP